MKRIVGSGLLRLYSSARDLDERVGAAAHPPACCGPRPDALVFVSTSANVEARSCRLESHPFELAIDPRLHTASRTVTRTLAPRLSSHKHTRRRHK
jgi:hypothetical protein